MIFFLHFPKNLILFFCLFLNTFSYSQTPDWSWVDIENGQTNGILSYKITTDKFGFVYVAGMTYLPQSFGSTALGNSNDPVPFILKYNNKGDIIWALAATRSSTSGAIKIGDLKTDNKGNIYLIGSWSGSDITFGGQTLNYTSYNSYDGFIFKIDAGGNSIWNLKIGGDNQDFLYSMDIDDENHIYLTGTLRSSQTYIEYYQNGSIIHDTLYAASSGKDDILVIKYDEDGGLIWSKSFGTASAYEYAYAITVDENENTYIGGYWESATSTSFGSITVTKSGSNSSDEQFILKLDENGDEQWVKAAASGNDDRIYKLEIQSSAIYSLGRFNYTIAFDNTSFTSVASSIDMFLAKYDLDGNLKWAKQLGMSAGSELPNNLSIDNNENLFISGGHSSNDTLYFDAIAVSAQNSFDMFLAKYDSAGNAKWGISIGGNGVSTGGFPGVSCDNQNGIYFCGYFDNQNIIVLANDSFASTDSNYDIFVAALVDFSDTVSIYDTTAIYSFDNGGLYGGSSTDLTYSQNNRLFSGIETPVSLFISDDEATTWYKAFDNDSLEYTTNGIERGWSGKATKILTNQNNWVAVLTNHPKNKYSAVVISYNNGDTNTYKTAIDPLMLNNFGYGSYTASAIALSDYNLYAALGPCVVKIGSGAINSVTDITNILSAISGLPSTSTVNSIALANNANAYPYYIAIDENGDENGYNRLLYRFNGSTYAQINLPSTLNGIQAVFTHPTQTSGDTIFVTGIDINTSAYKIYRSFDAGINWSDVSYSSASDFLSDVDYSAYWNLSSSNNIILIIPGNAISKDLGATWDVLANEQTANVIKPDDLNTIVGSDKTVEISTTGTSGSFTRMPSYGLESLEVNKIARTESESIFYIATKTGLGYTKSYLDTTLSAGEKWTTPNGVFPLISDTIDFGAVAIDPTDSLHVIAGSKYGFYISTNGINFTTVAPTNFTSDNPQVKDIVLINHNTAIAVTGGDSAYDTGKGNIWRTIDGGLNWTNVSPSGFKSGNSIAIGSVGTDTAIYIGTGLLNVDTGYLYKSTDLGITWLRIKNGPTSMAGTSILGLPINDIAIDPRGKDTLYIAAGYENEYAFVLSFDGGETFIYLNSYTQKPYTSIAINRNNPDTVYTASGREIYLYDLLNNNFRFVFRGLPDEQIPDLMTGSILVGTTTGFYTFDPNLEPNPIDTLITNNHTENLNGIVVNVYPNPFSDEATIRLTLKDNADVAIDLYDLTGRKIQSIYKGKSEKGSTNYNFTANNLASGTYLINIKVNEAMGRRLLYHVE